MARMTSVRSPLQAQVVQWQVGPGDLVREGDLLVVLEAMKMEHEVRSPAAGRVRERHASEGEMVAQDEVLLVLEAAAAQAIAFAAPRSRCSIRYSTTSVERSRPGLSTATARATTAPRPRRAWSLRSG